METDGGFQFRRNAMFIVERLQTRLATAGRNARRLFPMRVFGANPLITHRAGLSRFGSLRDWSRLPGAAIKEQVSIAGFYLILLRAKWRTISLDEPRRNHFRTGARNRPRASA